MLASVNLVCRAGEIISPGTRWVEFEEMIDCGRFMLNRFIVKYWNEKASSQFMNFVPGTLLVISGRLGNDDAGNTIVICEKVQFLSSKDVHLEIL
ncbi:MAG: hypothetical protein RSE56_00130 [Bacilli bacterium]